MKAVIPAQLQFAGAIGVEANKASAVTSLALNFDASDEFIRTGVTFGALRCSLGKLKLNDVLAMANRASAGTVGRF